MALTKWGFVYLSEALEVRRDAIGSPECTLVALGIPNVSEALEAAIALSDEGCQLIEFCGAFGARELAGVIPALHDRGIPMGAVTYGADAVEGLHHIFG